MVIRIVIFFCVISSLFSCSLFESEKELSSYLSWINDEENGLVKRKYIHGLEITVKYLPADFLAYQELRNNKGFKEFEKDSLINYYGKTLTFLLNVSPDERDSINSSTDIMYRDVHNMQDYQQRSVMMNFEMADYVELRTSDSLSYKPILTNMENTYGLGNGRNIVFVFAPASDSDKLKTSNEFDLIWDDVIFESGRSHFVFNSENILSAPRLKF